MDLWWQWLISPLPGVDRVNKEKPSGVIQHNKNCASSIDNATTLKREEKWFPRKVREAMEIQYHNSEPENGGMNLDSGSYVKTQFWKPMFEYMQRKKVLDVRPSLASDVTG